MNWRRLGLEIKIKRTKMGWNQMDLAQRVGLSQPSVSRIEQGKSDARMSHIDRIAKELEIDLDEVLAEETFPQEKQKKPKRNLRDSHVNKDTETDIELRILGYEFSKTDPSLSINDRITQAIKNTKDVLSQIREGFPVELDKKLDAMSRSQADKTYHIVRAIEAYLKEWESKHEDIKTK